MATSNFLPKDHHPEETEENHEEVSKFRQAKVRANATKSIAEKAQEEP